MSQNKIALIEDDTMLADLTASFLSQRGLPTDAYYDGESFLESREIVNYAAIILDINLPGIDGLKLCQLIRDKYLGPILFLTARTEDTDMLLGYSAGADDYINKPVKPTLLLAKLQAILKRATRTFPKSSQLSQLPDLHVNRESQTAELQGVALELTADEIELLGYMAQHFNQVVSREQLFLEVVGRPYDGLDRVVDARISRLRKKFNSINGNPYEIKTAWRKGYVLSNKRQT